MPVARAEFAYSIAPEPHRERTKEILRAHPEIRELIGPHFASFWWTVGLVMLQVSLAGLVASGPWWVVVVVAYGVGAFASHSLFVMIHECSHRLVFRKRLPNILTGMLANLPLFFPSSYSFQKYHLKHHAYQGVYDLDADLPSRWEARLVGHSALRKALWLLLFPFFQMLRPFRLKEIAVLDAWSVTNLVVLVAADVTIFALLGPKALAYCALSFFFSIGLHPLGARWIQRHYLTAEGEQETFSYYGPLNAIAFNVGYHTEHHDFPSVPWNRLPQVRKLAPEAYQTLACHTSWTRLFFRWLFDRELSLFSRMVRRERRRGRVEDEVAPDLDAIARERAAGASSGSASTRASPQF